MVGKVTSQKVIIVGNGPSLLDKENGHLIDGFDRVVRFNAYTIRGVEKWVGSKVTDWFNVINFQSSYNERLKTPYQRIVWHSWHWNPATDKGYQNMQKNCTCKNIEKTERSIILEIQEYMNNKKYFTYSTGAIAIWKLLKEFPQVTITGFDWWEGRDRHHYNDGGKLGSIHKPNEEFKLISKLQEEGKVNILNVDMKKEQNWWEKEDEKYSSLYDGGYPIGNPMGLVMKFGIPRIRKAIDLGCGRASLSRFFSDYTGVDVSSSVININKTKNTNGTYHHLSLHDLKKLYEEVYDVAICADVMEHIPPDRIDDVLSSISALNCNEFHFGISTRPSVILDNEGNNLHLTVLPAEEWESIFQKHFDGVELHIVNKSLCYIKCRNRK